MNLTFSKVIKLALLTFIALVLISLFVYYTQNPKGLSNMNFFFAKDELIEISNETFSPSGLENVYVKTAGTGCGVEIFYTDSPDFNAVLITSDPANVNPLDIKINGNSITLTVTHNIPVNIGFSYRTTLDLYIPRSYAENLYISASSGSVRTTERLLSFKNFSVETSSGSIHTEDVSAAGSLRFSTSSGSHHIGGISANLAEFSATSGSVSTGKLTITGDLTVKTSSGTIRTENISSGNTKLSVTSGGIKIQDVNSTGDFSAETSSGSIKTGDITALSAFCSTTSGGLTLGIVNSPSGFTAKTSSGSTKIDSVTAASIECSATSGSIKIGHAEGNMDLSGSSGGISVDTAIGNGKFKTTSASVKVSFSSVTGDLSLQSSSGSVNLSIPHDASVEGSFHTSSGSFKSDFDFNNQNRNNYEFTTGGGEYKLTASTSSGSIKVGSN